RTPVTGIRGYLETLLEQPLSEEQARYFVKQAYDQTIALSELICDMSLITKMEEAAQSFTLERVNLSLLLQTLKEDLSSSLKEKEMTMQWEIDEKIEITGNKSLLYAIFRNLVDNAIKYAGEQVHIRINLYNEDRESYYFSFYDTGVGIPDESHLNRLFERFYRINEGRERDTGGSGLGLSIVKNAILFHKGNIVAKNRAGGGLEFLFRISKK
ncbi:HAMP domain-containing histidine kinase, partial [Bacteroidales bacterium OttesenSCG-928-J19]|nr:HAMP domain-containing histidine kinase [Bacteroidales bacterium OttesenSCG-928-J19]